MIRVIIELIPSGNETKRHTLQTVEIVNTNTNPEEQPTLGRYQVRLNGVWLAGRVEHERATGVWPLLRKVCTKCLHAKRNG